MVLILKDHTGQWGELSVLEVKDNSRVREGVGTPLEEEECGEGARQTSPPELRTEVFILPEDLGISCISGNATCWSSHGLQAPSFSLTSNSHVLDVGAQEQEVLGETRQNWMVKASSTPKRCISVLKGNSHLGKRALCQKPDQCISGECPSVPEFSIKYSFWQLSSLRWRFMSFSKLLLPGRPQKCPLCHLHFLPLANNTKLWAAEVYVLTSSKVSVTQRGKNSELKTKSYCFP